MSTISPDQPVFLSNPHFQTEGLTLRQYYAGLAMQGLLSNPDENKRPYYECKIPELKGCKNLGEFLAKTAVMMADAMIAELNKGEAK